MMIRSTFFTLLILADLSLTLASSVDVNSAEAAKEGGYVIWDGNCNNITAKMLVSTDHVNLKAVPFYKRDHTTEWHSDKIVTCVSVLNMKGTKHPGTANITKGGYGHSFVAVYMESERGYGMEFLVNIYAV